MFSCCHDSKMRAFTLQLYNHNSGERSHMCNMSSAYVLASFKIGNVIEGQFFASLLEYYHPSRSINGATFSCLKGVVLIVLQEQLELQLTWSIEKCNFIFFSQRCLSRESVCYKKSAFYILYFVLCENTGKLAVWSFILSQYLLLKAPLCV